MFSVHIHLKSNGDWPRGDIFISKVDLLFLHGLMYKLTVPYSFSPVLVYADVYSDKIIYITNFDLCHLPLNIAEYPQAILLGIISTVLLHITRDTLTIRLIYS